MKFRSALLCAFMLVVPGAAMFSHRIPAPVRAGVREWFHDAMASWSTSESKPARAEPPASDELVAHESSQTAAGAATPALRAELPRSSSLDSQPMAANDIEKALRALGAQGIECRAVHSTAGIHVATCSVPLDATGQLMRVFHASGANSLSAERSLLAEVESWRHRTAARVRDEATTQPALGSGPILRY